MTDSADTAASQQPSFRIERPAAQTAPVVLASPHSGRVYPASFLDASQLDRHAVRRSEDAFVEDLFAAAPDFGMPLMHAQFPRAFVDANREPYELDPAMFSEPLPDWINTASPRVAAGLGTVARIVAGGAEIYRRPLRLDDVLDRIRQHYEPYHRALGELVRETRDAFGFCLLVDCHSMPSIGAPGGWAAGGNTDIVLGDCHGSTCARSVVTMVERTLAESGLSVRRNKPYAGGYTTRHYARPHAGVHTLQIEINRALYMDEVALCKNAGFDPLADKLRRLLARLADVGGADLSPSLAAE